MSGFPSSVGTSVPVTGTYATAATIIESAQVTGDTNNRFTIGADGKLSWGPGTGATDTNLYRNSPAEVRTDGYLEAALDIFASHTLATAVRIGRAGPASQSGISFQNGEAGCVLYRSGVGALSATGLFSAAGDSYARYAGATQVKVGSAGPASESGISFQNGEAGSNIYRYSAGALQCDGTFVAGADLGARYGAATKVALGNVGPSAQSGISFQNGEAGSNIYRSSAGTLTSDGAINAVSYLGTGLNGVGGVFRPASAFGGTNSTMAFALGAGAPNNANGNNGDIYMRSDGGTLSTVYQKRAGAWAGIV